jgi:hypothetical protein
MIGILVLCLIVIPAAGLGVIYLAVKAGHCIFGERDGYEEL